MILSSQVGYQKLTLRSHNKKKKTKKGTKHLRIEKYDLREVITQVKRQVYNFRINEIINKREY